MRKIAQSFKIVDKTQVKELTELSIVLRARELAHGNFSLKNRYQSIADLYHKQVNVSHRTSQSVLLQQYSTPAPIGLLLGMFVNADQDISIFEPSAGNGLLTILAEPSRVTVNEIDPFRNANLSQQGFKQVLKRDATKPFAEFSKYFDAIVTNPPFGILPSEVMITYFLFLHTGHLVFLLMQTIKANGY